jgi:rubrerythrin
MAKAIDTAVRAMRLLKAQEPREMSDVELMDAIRKAPIIVKPAVDAAPVVHARWKTVKAGASNNYPFWDSKCSECGYTTAITTTGWRYCPRCGAKMDKEG